MAMMALRTPGPRHGDIRTPLYGRGGFGATRTPPWRHQDPLIWPWWLWGHQDPAMGTPGPPYMAVVAVGTAGPPHPLSPCRPCARWGPKPRPRVGETTAGRFHFHFGGGRVQVGKVPLPGWRQVGAGKVPLPGWRQVGAGGEGCTSGLAAGRCGRGRFRFRFGVTWAQVGKVPVSLWGGRGRLRVRLRVGMGGRRGAGGRTDRSPYRTPPVLPLQTELRLCRAHGSQCHQYHQCHHCSQCSQYHQCLPAPPTPGSHHPFPAAAVHPIGSQFPPPAPSSPSRPHFPPSAPLPPPPRPSCHIRSGATNQRAERGAEPAPSPAGGKGAPNGKPRRDREVPPPRMQMRGGARDDGRHPEPIRAEGAGPRVTVGPEDKRGSLGHQWGHRGANGEQRGATEGPGGQLGGRGGRPWPWG